MKKTKTILITSFALLFFGVITTFATWPTVPQGSVIGGWLGEVFDISNSNSTKLIIESTNVGIGTTSPTQKLEVNGKIKMSSQTTASDSDDTVVTKGYMNNNQIPSGVIVMWSGSTSSIPNGWQLCNGTSGTPDLRDRFIVGAGNSYSVGNIGGSNEHSHNIGSHTHQWYNSASGTDMSFDSVGNLVNISHSSPDGVAIEIDSSSHGLVSDYYTSKAIGNTGTASNLPKYYALAYIIKN